MSPLSRTQQIFFCLFLDAVFCENTEPRSLQDKQKRAKQTFEGMMNYIPGIYLKSSLI